MTKGTKAFRIIICILLGLTILWTAFISYAFIYYSSNAIAEDTYGIYVAGVAVTRENARDVLGDGTVFYQVSSNSLTFRDAVIDTEYAAVYSLIDLRINLVGENKFICNGDDAMVAVYASDGILRKDLSFEGDGSLTIEFKDAKVNGTGIVAEDLWFGADVTITSPNCENISNGIICTSSMTLRNEASVTVRCGAARSSTAVSVRGNLVIENGSNLDVSVAPGATEACNGVCVEGSLLLGSDATLSVVIDDEVAEESACINVLGAITVAPEATVNASAKVVSGVECYASVRLDEGATVNAATAGERADIFCYGSLVDYGATVRGEVAALGGIHREASDGMDSANED